MPIDPYANCPCGSGKKFKWCCSAYFDSIEKALDMLQQSQFENACRTMENLAKQYPDRPQILGYYAHILFREDQMQKAEETLDRAFQIDPQFPMGFFLKGLFRQSEGEVIGALMMYRKAVEAYPRESTDQLSQVYEMIARNELMLNHLLASRFALELAVRFAPQDEEIAQQYMAIFGPNARMPDIVTQPRDFRRTLKPMSVKTDGKLSSIRKTLELHAEKTPSDPAIWYNLGLVLAWLGEHGPASTAFQKSLELEWDDDFAQDTGALIELMTCGQGNDQDSDYIAARSMMQVRDGNAVMQLLQSWDQEQRIFAPQSDEEGTSFSCMLVEPLPSLVDTGTKLVKVVANVQIDSGIIRVWSTLPENTAKIAGEIRERLNMAVSEPVSNQALMPLGEIVQEAMAFPAQVGDPAEAEQKMAAFAENFFENTWIHRPRKALANVAPVDAVGSSLLRKKLFGVIRFWESALNASSPRKRDGDKILTMSLYDFSRLRHKIGLEKNANAGPPAEALAEAEAVIKAEEAQAAEAAEQVRLAAEREAFAAEQARQAAQREAEEKARAEAAAAAAAAPVKRDFSSMSAADLAGIDRETLTQAELEEGMRSALKLDARELAVAFARTAITKPADAAKPDRYPLYLCAIQGAIAESNLDQALSLASDGTTYDAAHNEGKRANDFTVQRARLLCRKGDPDAAAAEFTALIERNPDEAKYYITATESFLSAKQPAKATHFADLGLAKARSLGNRDLEGACLELGEAAKKMMG